MPSNISAPSRPGVERIDLLAARVLRSAEPFHFSLARSHAELEAAQHLRYRTVLEQGWTVPDEFPSGMERDQYDDAALHVIAVRGQAVVGTARIVLPRPGFKLPMEEAFGLKLSNPAVEVGRVCRGPDSHDFEHRVFLGLLAQVWMEMRKRDFIECCGAAGQSMIRLWQVIGFRVITLAPPQSYWGENRWPVVIRPSEALARFDETVNAIQQIGGDKNEAIQPQNVVASRDCSGVS